MIEKQRTIKDSVSLSGIGLHTGTSCTITFKPAPENYGIRFIRTDLGGSPEIPALCDFVVDVSRGTTLGIGEARVHTVEHVLAAIVGLQIDNIRIELDGIEPPVGDGSALPYVDVLLQAGFSEQNAARDYLIIEKTEMYQDEENEVHIVALPLDGYRMTVMVDYQNPALGSQHSGLFDLEKEFVSEFAPARTFCFLSEVEMLSKQGLIKGGQIDNAIVIVDKKLSDEEVITLQDQLEISTPVVIGTTGILGNKELRFKNEPVRHKLLDLMGDFALIGAPLKAQILAARPGHKSNVEFAKQIRRLYQQKQIVKKYQHIKTKGVVFDLKSIAKLLPHRYPFLLVDKIIELEFDKRVVGVKNVTINEPFFNGHFPGEPIMPGVLILEAMGQAGGVLLLNSIEHPEKKLVFFMQINNAKFRKPVIPGDQLVMELEMKQQRGKIVMMSGKSFVDGTLVAEADFMAIIKDREPTEEKQ